MKLVAEYDPGNPYNESFTCEVEVPFNGTSFTATLSKLAKKVRTEYEERFTPLHIQEYAVVVGMAFCPEGTKTKTLGNGTLKCYAMRSQKE